jgi:hypothetical protein
LPLNFATEIAEIIDMLRRVGRYLLLTIGPLLPILGCNTKSAQQSSKVSVTFPQAQSNRSAVRNLSSVGKLDYNFSLACYAINITAPDIANSAASACGVPVGLFSGFVAPGTDLTISVPHGTARELQVYAFLRPSAGDSCPTQTSLQGLDLSTVARLGVVSSFDTMSDTVDLTVNLTAPADGTSLASQGLLPATCVPPPLATTANVVAGASTLTGGGYTMVGKVSGLKNEMFYQAGGQYIVILSRRAQ